ncbi:MULTISPECIES: bifunctional diguanylate cyclase/phosphodiesterase [Lachnospiraceae]|jgi:diguanylate cyclase (GGDEF)-like protein|uniref:GGDEF domain-containing protein n=1 Tax=Faecalicatena acetigenes TaxID=2981790 RepID=A0ABT2T7E7_9FIRM|nr:MULTISPECIES: GGDEF domain-containing protein [Lachnospiraceae]MCU6746193.1 GGDEF domain-containing protein [Faecalicatena acetigenes]RGT75072.1 GGDEF domain-containing protein [Ruminococcus sp. AF18-22]SCH00592.1 Bacteriophytochrome cph2 [uncultured Clostridium sp.]
MGEKERQRSLVEIMNDVLSTVRDYYDAEYVYYIEKEYDDVEMIYEWCAENVPWQRDKIKMMGAEQQPKWMKQEITDTTEDNYSIFEQIREDTTAILAVIGVHKGGCELSLMRAVLPFITQAIVLQKQQKQQEYLSYHDDLTGLLNRNSFVQYLTEAEEKKWKTLGALSVDINGLKNFNKEFGRDYGDEVVIRVGEVLEEFFKSGMVFRLTGDEYLAIAEDASYEDFMKNVHAAHDKLDNISLGLVTMGYAWEKIDINVDNLVAHAENMMREEKQKYYRNLKKGHQEPIIKQDLLQDIEQGSFIVCLVPKMDVATEEIVGAEAVVRYHHKDLGILNPERYITLLQETRLSHYLDLYVFEEVCKTLRRWEREDIPMLPISVNFAGATLCQVDIADRMMALIEKYHVSCEYLEVEVSESYANMNQEMLTETSNKIRKENVRVILDHFGAKDSSLSILSVMEFDGLKLDKGIVSNIVSSGRSRIVAKAVIDICRQLGAYVLASGVETQDQLNVLNELGCHYAQGSLFNKPITIDTFEVRYLKDR